PQELDGYYYPEDGGNGTNDEYWSLGPSDNLLCSLEEVRAFSRLFVPVAYSLICVCGLLGNVLVVVTFAFYKKAKSMTDVYLLNMAVADILSVLTLPFLAATHAADEWLFSNAVCKLVRGVHSVNFYCGMLLLACVSLDRYVAIVQATRSFRLRARALAHRRGICLAVWAVSVLISVATFVFYQKYPAPGPVPDGGRQSHVCEPRYAGVSEPLHWKLLMLGLQLLFGFFVPLVFMVVCYLLIVRTLLRAQNAKRHRAVRVVLAVVLVFLLCQVPHNLVLLVTAANLGSMGRSCRGEKLLGYARQGTEALAFLRCCLNPVLYAFVGQKFRGYFLRIMKGLLCVRRGPKAPGFSCPKLQSDTFASRQNSETPDNDNASSFTM
ncbi:C-C chemokine receptor type 6, partial [Phyllostomus discolor]|uniref:C-C chemokine receptor type 6 n=1 Tax=Phyllostomus discolor TaxID=89673 RepID=A0A6J2KYU0_9CHIR